MGVTKGNVARAVEHMIEMEFAMRRAGCPGPYIIAAGEHVPQEAVDYYVALRAREGVSIEVRPWW